MNALFVPLNGASRHWKAVTFLLVGALGGYVVGIGQDASTVPPAEAAATSSDDAGTPVPYALIARFAEVLKKIEIEYVDPVSRERLLDGAIRGMVSELDPHSAYMKSDEFKIFRGDTSGEFGGIGVEVDFSNDEVIVMSTVEGAPAERAGVIAGDKILAVDQSPLRGKSAFHIVKLMRGKIGTSLSLLIRPADGAEHRVTLNREKITVRSVMAKSLDGGLLYLRLRSFQENSHAELLQVLEETQRSKGFTRPHGIILDLRNNPGGLVDQAIAIADEFLDSGKIFSTRYRNGLEEIAEATHGGVFTSLPVFVLINEYSASASELLTGALRDSGGAMVVGNRSFGKGSVQTIFELGDGAGMKLTSARYYTPKGTAIQAQGISPDILIIDSDDIDPETGTAQRRQQSFSESDLEGHLLSENPVSAEQTPRLVVITDTAERSEEKLGLAPTHFGVIQNPDSNPEHSQDAPLRIAYRLMKAQFHPPSPQKP